MRRDSARVARAASCAERLRNERRARRRAEQWALRASFLADAGPVLTGAFEAPSQVLTGLTRLAVPQLASFCSVRLVRDDGMIDTASLAHVDAEKEAALMQLAPEFVFPVQAVRGVPSEGERSFLVNGTEACLESAYQRLPEFPPTLRATAREVLRIAGLHAYMAVPLGARGRHLGMMFFGRSTEDRAYEQDDLAVAQALAAHAALAIDNARLYDEAQRALTAREDFLAVASHELKTPLTSLQIAVQALLVKARDDATRGGRPFGEPLLRAVDRSATRLGALVDDLLDISRLTSEASPPVRHPVDLGEVVDEVVDALTDTLRSAGCTLSKAVRAPTRGAWDRSWLVRIVTNLLSNAAKYGRGGPIDVALEGGDDVARLIVRDHGIGIAPEQQARIFERFEKAVSIRHYGGFGLGLWSARRMVEALGGSIRVESRVGEGAVFTVELPRGGPLEGC
jgi:signal transduction histidine kinase